MAQPRPTRLREVQDDLPQSARIIDAPFKVVKGRRSRLASFGRWMLVFTAAAAIGFLVPPVWVVVQEIFSMARAE